MADEHSPQVEITPTVIVSNSNEGEEITNAEEISTTASNETVIAAEPSAEVAIAEIEAERDIALASIHSGVERERIAAEQQQIEVIAERNEELEECRREIVELREKVEQLTLLIQPKQLVEVTEEALETAPEPNSIQPSTAAPTLETMTELSEESVEESPVEEMPTAVRVRRFIAI